MTSSRSSAGEHSQALAESRNWLAPRALAGALIALGCGIGALLQGYYDLSAWGWISPVMLALAGGLLIASPGAIRGPALIACLALGGYAVWSLASIAWAESADAALIDGDRLALYAALFVALCLLLSTGSAARLALISVTGGALIGALVVTIRLLADGSELFLADRLHEPLGYVNGQAAYLLVPVWPLIAVAERAKRADLAGLAAAAAAACAGLSLLGQSRGAILALAASAVVMLALVPGRLGRLWLVAGIVAVLTILATGPLGEIYDLDSTPGDGAIQDATVAILLWSLALGAVWAAGRAGWPRLVSRIGEDRGLLVARVAAAGLALVVAVALVARFDPLRDGFEDQYDSFTSLSKVGQQGDRLISGGGNRYDYWRIAWRQFEDEPLRGIGAGNYDTTYFQERRNAEAVRQAHSIELQALGETGLVGGLLLFAFLGTVLWAIRARARPNRERSDPLIALAGGGVFAVWLAQTSVDWMHLTPGLAGCALVGAAALVQPWIGVETRRPQGHAQLALAGLILAVMAVAAVIVIRPVLAERQLDEGFGELRSDPASALDRAQTALGLNSQSVEAYYLAAAAYARVNDYDQSREALESAIELEPSNHVSWVLLGDLQARRGDTAAARRSYLRALELNPRERQIRRLAANPPRPGRS